MSTDFNFISFFSLYTCIHTGRGVCDVRDERLVALNVDYHVERHARRGTVFFERFGTAVGAAAMLRGGHDGLSAETFDGPCDAFVVGGDAAVVEYLCRAFVYVLYHGFALDVGEGFAGKPRGGVAGRNDGYEFNSGRFFGTDKYTFFRAALRVFCKFAGQCGDRRNIMRTFLPGWANGSRDSVLRPLHGR